MRFKLHIWRQENARAKGHFETYEIDNISADCSFLEMLAARASAACAASISTAVPTATTTA